MTTRSIRTMCSTRLSESESGTRHLETRSTAIPFITIRVRDFEIYRANAAIYDNLIYDNKYNMRLFRLQEGYHRLDIYRNRFHNPPGIADHIFFNAWATTPKDSETEIYFYHNSIAGGRDAFLMAEFMPGYGMPRTYIVDNVIWLIACLIPEATLVAKRDMGLFDYNWMGGASWEPGPGTAATTSLPGRKAWSDATLPDSSCLRAAMPEAQALTSQDLSRSRA